MSEAERGRGRRRGRRFKAALADFEGEGVQQLHLLDHSSLLFSSLLFSSLLFSSLLFSSLLFSKFHNDREGETVSAGIEAKLLEEENKHNKERYTCMPSQRGKRGSIGSALSVRYT